MLQELHVRDFAIIDELSLTFKPGFVVFTGETGAGKSIIVDAVEMLLGGRADTSMVRADCDLAIIEGVFYLDDAVRERVTAILDAEGLLDSSDHIVLGREIRLEGRNICRVNGRSVNLSLLREIGELVVDVHGQSEHLSLLRVAEHIHLLDRYAQVDDLLEEYREYFEELRIVRAELRRLLQAETDASRRMDLLQFQLNEIEAAQLQQGEEEALKEERLRLANAEQLAQLTETVLAALVQGDTREVNAVDSLGLALEAMQRLSRLDPTMQDVNQEMDAVVEQTMDISRRMRAYLEMMEFNPGRLEEVEERLGLIHDLKRKFGDGIAAILDYAEKARSELDGITHSEERKGVLQKKENLLVAQLARLGIALSTAREEAGRRLAENIEQELKDLRMEGARFSVAQRMQDAEEGIPVGERRVAFNANGFDQVEFMVAPNLGEGLKPLVKVASGGETSRLMLGLKTVLTAADHVPSLIFDEIDQGIGGRVGVIVGRKLWNLASGHQVLCITHLPQLAAFGDQHYKVEKHVADGRTVAATRELDEEARIPELAQMLGGITEVTLESAAEVLRRASAEKQLQAN